jgi:hypothetical protein
MQPTTDAPTEVLVLPAGPPRRRRTLRWLVAGLVVVALAAGGAVAVTRHRAAAQPGPAESSAVATAKIERKDLSTTKSLPGTIGYGTARPLAGHKEATVTWLPAAGATIKRGKQLYRADDRPVQLFYGSMPMYRAIAGLNTAGRDVRIVADNLKALGYPIGRQPGAGARLTQPPPAGSPPGTAGTPVRVRDGDGVLTAGLITAIKHWQDDAGMAVTGAIAVGDVEVLSGAIRIDAVTVQPGSPANAPLMSVTPTRKVVTVAAELGDATAIHQGDRVTVKLPDDRTLKARVTGVGRNLAAEENGGGTGPQKLTVTVTVDDPKTIDRLDSGDVQVDFAGRTAEGVLAVPIEALIALTEGGYAVQAPAGLLAVKTGMFADGWVEVSGAGLTEGLDVVVSS